ncbi:hypothetical protein CYLTODRAFT_463017 [Cylindrobasidium torrendii FP15055 ss-10]|uniref:Uncharacterized protein n=1 Tax=Cylindrobasidium torrendii FP15055 ss-10 TaxID=1314674 RepID=A0A0D7B8P5_9AGAR|nr:hypothetical protein CYLTODRAFT_463017 [Cylindrobasidium torrendii FP15055 ss-10]
MYSGCGRETDWVLQMMYWPAALPDTVDTYSGAFDGAIAKRAYHGHFRRLLVGYMNVGARESRAAWIQTEISADFDIQWRFCRQAECACPNHKIPQLLHQSALVESNDEKICRSLSLNNDEPGTTEIAAVRSAISTIQAKATNVSNTVQELRELRQLLSAQIEHVDATLRDLEVESVKMVEVIAARKLPLNPVRRLPNELLQKIFRDLVSLEGHVSCEQESVYPTPWLTPNGNESPLWALELVCKGWREALMGDTEIWSIVHIQVSPTNFDPYFSSRTYSQVLMHLDRSGQSDLSMTISLAPDFHEDHIPAPFLAFLLPYASRIRKFQLVLPFRLLQDFSCMAPRLRGVESLYLINACTRLADAIQRPIPSQVTSFAQCTRLQSLVLADSMNKLMSLDLHWRSLRTVTATHNFIPIFGPVQSPSPRPGQYRHLLDMAKDLEDVYLDLEVCHQLPLVVVPAAIVCARLINLDLCIRPGCDGSNFAVEQLFRNVSLPSLETLLVQGRFANGQVTGADINSSALRALFRCIPSTLRSCHITGLRLATLEILFDLFNPLQRLESMILKDIDSLRPVGKPLSLAPFVEPLLELTELDVIFPKLHTLELEGQFCPEGDIEQKVRRLAYRLRTNGVLKGFRVLTVTK